MVNTRVVVQIDVDRELFEDLPDAGWTLARGKAEREASAADRVLTGEEDRTVCRMAWQEYTDGGEYIQVTPEDDNWTIARLRLVTGTVPASHA